MQYDTIMSIKTSLDREPSTKGYGKKQCLRSIPSSLLQFKNRNLIVNKSNMSVNCSSTFLRWRFLCNWYKTLCWFLCYSVAITFIFISTFLKIIPILDSRLHSVFESFLFKLVFLIASLPN